MTDFMQSLAKVQEALGRDFNSFIERVTKIKQFIKDHVSIEQQEEEGEEWVDIEIASPRYGDIPTHMFHFIPTDESTYLQISGTYGDRITKEHLHGIQHLQGIQFNGNVTLDNDVLNDISLSKIVLKGVQNIPQNIVRGKVLESISIDGGTNYRGERTVPEIEIPSEFLQNVQVRDLMLVNVKWSEELIKGMTFHRFESDTIPLRGFTTDILAISGKPKKIKKDDITAVINTRLDFESTDSTTTINIGAITNLSPDAGILFYEDDNTEIKLSNIPGIVYLNFDNSESLNIPDDPIIGAKINDQRRRVRELMAKGLPFASARKKVERILSTPRQQTKWQTICSHLGKEFKLLELREIANQLGIATEGKSKRALCTALAQDYENFISRAKVKERGCTNEESLLGDAYDSLSDNEVLEYTENGQKYCFTVEEIKQLSADWRTGKKLNPFTRNPIPMDIINQAMTREVRPDPRTTIHEMLTVASELTSKQIFERRAVNMRAPPLTQLEAMNMETARRLVRTVKENVRFHQGSSAQFDDAAILLAISQDKYKGLLMLLDAVGNDEMAGEVFANFFVSPDRGVEGEDEESFIRRRADGSPARTGQQNRRTPGSEVVSRIALFSAAQSGDFNEVERLLIRGDEPTDDILRVAAENGYLAIVNLILPVSPGINSSDALIGAANNGYDVIVSRLLDHPGTNPSANNNEALRYAAENEHDNVVNLLLQQESVRNGRLVFTDGRGVRHDLRERAGITDLNRAVDMEEEPTESDEESPLATVVRPRLPIVRPVIRSARQREFLVAAENGNASTIERMLAIPEFNPAFNNNEALRGAEEEDRDNIVYLLLRDERVRAASLRWTDNDGIGHDLTQRAEVARETNPYVGDIYAGDIESIRRRIDEGVDPSANSNQALQAAVRTLVGYDTGDIITLLLQQQSVRRNILEWTDASGVEYDLRSRALSIAATQGDLENVNSLLEDGTAPAANDNQALHRAEENGHSEIVDRLLQIETVRNGPLRWTDAEGEVHDLTSGVRAPRTLHFNVIRSATQTTAQITIVSTMTMQDLLIRASLAVLGQYMGSEKMIYPPEGDRTGVTLLRPSNYALLNQTLNEVFSDTSRDGSNRDITIIPF